MKSKLEQLQRAIADLVSRLELMRGVTVVLERGSTLEGKLDEKLLPKVGICVIIRMPVPTAGSATGGAITYGTLLTKLRVVENLLTNTTGLSASYLAESLLKQLIDKTPIGAASALALRPDYPYYQLAGSATSNSVEISMTTSLNL